MAKRKVKEIRSWGEVFRLLLTGMAMFLVLVPVVLALFAFATRHTASEETYIPNEKDIAFEAWCRSNNGWFIQGTWATYAICDYPTGRVYQHEER